MATLTSASAIYMLSVAGLFNTPQPLSGFAVDDMFTTESNEPVQTQMGADGTLSGGWTPVPFEQTISIQADSASNTIFDQWYDAQVAGQELLLASARITILGTSTLYNGTRGFLVGYKRAPDAKRILAMRQYKIRWNFLSVQPQQ